MSNTVHFEKILTSNSSKICVVAGPGSGKTKGVLIPKAKSLIDANIDPKQILLLSFSRLSAWDLKNKVKSLDKAPRTSTVHSFCLAYLLSENDHSIRDRIGSIVMDFELTYLIDDLKLLFPKIDKRDLRKMLEKFCAGWAVQPHDQVFEQDDEQKRFKAAVVNWLSEHSAVMIGEIVYFALDHIRKMGKPESLNSIKYIFIDEYQDLNKLEQEFVHILADGAELLLVVGDPDQSIYSFKFAWKQGIEDFFNHPQVDGHSLPYCGRCGKNILTLANQLLLQESPARISLPLPLEDKEDGEVAIKPFTTQDEELQFVVNSIRARLENGSKPEDILVLVPKRKLGHELITFVKTHAIVLPNGAKLEVVSKPQFTPKQQESILVLSLVVKPSSMVHIRSYVGMPDGEGYAPELASLKKHYGSWRGVLDNVKLEDFQPKFRRIRTVCIRLLQLKQILENFRETDPVAIINKLFPESDSELQSLNYLLKSFIDEDGIEEAYGKFIDYMRSLPQDSQTIQVMTIMESKGLEAPHVYIIGCNAGNIPGENRSAHLSDFEHKQEQRRLLYVGCTRAQQSLTITWSQYIPFGQSMRHHTSGVATTTINGKIMKRVGVCEFIQDLHV